MAGCWHRTDEGCVRVEFCGEPLKTSRKLDCRRTAMGVPDFRQQAAKLPSAHGGVGLLVSGAGYVYYSCHSRARSSFNSK